MHPTQVKTTYNRNADTVEQTTTGVLGSVPYMIVKRTDYGPVDRRGGRQGTTRHSIYVKNDQHQWVAASELRSREALISFGFIQED